MNVPNHSQTSRIRFDVQRLQNGQDPLYWRGNSYQGIPTTFAINDVETLGIRFKHWDTTIAAVTASGVLYFNARYISTTTRGFQSRIVNALATAFGENHAAVVRIREELALPTGERDILDWRESEGIRV